MRKNLIFLFVCIAFAVDSQVPSELVSLKELYSDQDYVVIEDQTEVEISLHKEKGIEIMKTSHFRIYLTNDRAGLFKNDRIYSSYFEKLIDKEAYALNKKKGKDKYSKSKVRDFNTQETISEEVFFDDGSVTNFSYDGLKEESIINLTHKKELTDPHLSFYGLFGSSSPILNKSLILYVEDGIDVSTVYFNMDSTDVNYSVEKGRNETIYKWYKDTVEMYKPEHSSPNPKYFLPHVISRVTQYEDNDGNKVGVLEDVQDLYDWYLSLINNVRCESQLELQSVVDQINDESDSELERVKNTFEWVQNNIKYIAIEDGLGGFIPRGPDLVMNRRYGDCKDMSTLIVQLLELQGIKAHQVWIGTNAIPYEYEEIPSPVVDNHMIAAYYDKANQEYIFLDATDDKIAFGYPSGFIQGKQALINLGDSYEIVEVPVMPANKTLMIDTARVFIDGDRLGGNGELYVTGYYAADFKHYMKKVRNENSNKSQVEYITKKGSNKYHLGEYDVDIAENSVTYNYEFSIPNYVNFADDEVYVNLNLDVFLDFFIPYELEDRQTDVTEDYATQTNFVYTLEIPEGYAIDYVPDNLFVESEDIFHVKINYDRSVPGEITYEFDLFLDYIVLDVDRVPEMEKLGKKLKSAYKETIILKKIEDGK
jgi:hypothetical protein